MEADLDDRLTRLARTPACAGISMSPDGQRVAFCSNLSGNQQAWTVDAGGGWPMPVTALDDAVNMVRWSPDGRLLALLVAPGGGMHTQVYVVGPDGSGLRRLTRGGSETNVLTGWSPRGELLLSSNERAGDRMDALLVDAGTGERRVVADLGGVGGIFDVSGDGRYALLGRTRQRNDADVIAVDLDSGDEIDLTPHEGLANSRPGCFTPDGRTVYLATDVGRERSALARVVVGAGALEIVAQRGDADLGLIAASPDRSHAALVWNASGRFEIELLDLITGDRRPGPVPPAETLMDVGLSAGGQRLALMATGPAMPSNVWTWPGGGGDTPEQVTRHAPAGVDLAELVRPELVRLPAHDGLELSGWLYRAGEGPTPFVLEFHGGPEAQKLATWSPAFQSLLASGIGVFAPNVRGSSGFGKTFMNLDNGALRVNAVRDIRTCADFLLNAGLAQPGRLGITGASYGGFMTTAGITEYPDLFAAACTVAGMVNFETFFAHTEPWMAAISKVEYGDPDTEAEMLRRLSPIHRMDRARAATLVVHGANDTNVPVVEAEQVVASLRGRGVPVEYLLFPDEGHSLNKTANIMAYTAAMVRWFRRHLLVEAI